MNRGQFLLEKMIQRYDNETYSHCQQVSIISYLIGEVLELPQQDNLLICRAAALHDLGKICLPVEVLRKQGLLNKEEWDLIMGHPIQGYQLLKSHPDPLMKDISMLVLLHHERIDGKGYPCGVKGKEIPLGARVIAIADALQAMLTDRPYRDNPLTFKAALAQIEVNAGTQFDEEMARRIISWFRARGETLDVRLTNYVSNLNQEEEA
ncbi:MAG: HD-GYP domain-containing protein [Chitinophagales bacterium]